MEVSNTAVSFTRSTFCTSTNTKPWLPIHSPKSKLGSERHKRKNSREHVELSERKKIKTGKKRSRTKFDFYERRKRLQAIASKKKTTTTTDINSSSNGNNNNAESNVTASSWTAATTAAAEAVTAAITVVVVATRSAPQ
ncbi:unnamed protein product [Ceratitis capitata]|uniref:(Mediterranean fruit fly) hypothetical protein n=1 Tax=Ceratitis capitata TaxID=7213 RepID=A0A811U1F6_CERCA|nr:unnamed protein product [Ceratitis capitata]